MSSAWIGEALARAADPVRARQALRLALVLLAWLAAAQLALALSPLAGAALPVWLPGGVGLAALTLGGARLWPAVALGAVLVEGWLGTPWPLALGIGLGETLGALLGATLLRRCRLDPSLTHHRDVGLLLLASALAPLPGTLVRASLPLLGAAPASEPWAAWWTRDALGCLVLAPLLLTWSREPLRPPGRMPERAALVVTTLAMAAAVTGLAPASMPGGELYLLFPLLFWSATRLSVREAVATAFLVASVAAWAHALGAGPFVTVPTTSGLAPLQAFLGVFSLTSLLLGAAVAERSRAEEAQRSTQDALESRVAERTRQLALANEQLRLRELQLLQVQRVAHIGSWQWDLARGQVAWSEEMGGLLGRAERGASWRELVELTHPEDRPAVEESLLAAREGRPFDLEHRVLLPGGAVRYLHQRGQLLPGEPGSAGLVLGTATDITPRKEAEQARRLKCTADLAHYRAIVESAGAAIVSADLEGRITSWNTGAERLYGWTWPEVVGQGLSLLVPPGADEAPTWGRIRRGSSIEVPETPRLRKDGTVISVALTLSPILDEAGAIVGLSEVAQDLTERKRAERRFRLAVEAAPNAMLMVDAAGGVVLANAQAERLFGHSRPELLGQAAVSLIPEFERVAPPAAPGATQEPGLVARRRDGSEFPIEIGLTPIETSEGLFALCSIVDVTERKRTEEQLVHQAEELARSNAELEKFAYVTSHDLQEPMRMIASFCLLLRREYAARLDERGQRWLGFAVEGAERMQRLILDLLDYSRVQTRPRALELVACDEVVAEARKNLEQAIEEARGATIEVGPLPALMADRSQMVRLFQNLLANALKFRSAEPPRISISARREGQDWLFEVADNGIGIPPAHRERIFELFKRLHPRERYQGTGIGLAVCRTIVQRHGGRIWVEPDPGGGSRFRFTISHATQRVTPAQNWQRLTAAAGRTDEG